jgi:hypothetical protein
MRSRFGHFLARFSALVLAAGMVVGVVAAGSAQAQIPRSWREAIFGKHADDGRNNDHPPVVAHYMSARGEGFVLDETSQGSPLLRFDGDDEVFQLTAKPGANGDVILKNDIGQPVLKATRIGGMIVFSGTHADVGDPAAVTGQAQAFAPDRLSPAELWLHMAKSALHVSRLCDHRIDINADKDNIDEGIPNETIINLFAESVSVTTDALVQVASQGDTRHSLDKLHEVHLIEGRPPGARIDNGVLIIKVDPSRGTWGGHPSSKRIVNVVMAGADAEMRR